MYLQIFKINEISSDFNEISSDFNEITEINGFLSDFEISYRILGSVRPLGLFIILSLLVSTGL